MGKRGIELEEIKAYLAKGYTQTEAAEHFGVTPQAISFRLKYVPIPPRPPVCPRCGVREKAQGLSYCLECRTERNKELAEQKRAARVREIEAQYGIVGDVEVLKRKK